MKTKISLSPKRQKLLADTIRELALEGRFYEEKEAMQHGCTTIYQHSVHVAYVSLFLMEKWQIPLDEVSLVKGALLHDYFYMTGMKVMPPTGSMAFAIRERR